MSLPSLSERGIETLPLQEMDPGLRSLWLNFAEMSPIPSSSRQENQMGAYLESIAREKNLHMEKDGYGNLLIEIPATEGFENAPGIVIQAHMDMGCVGKPNPAVAGVRPYLDESKEWVTADTTLGADNRISLAAMKALSGDNTFAHGKYALMFTRAEEVGLIGARKMAFSNELEGYKYLINADSEEEGEVTFSSAGAGDSFINLPVSRQPAGNKKIISISMEGFKGGHSGVVIGKNHLNAGKAMAGLLENLTTKLEMLNIVSFSSGEKRNSIPLNAQALIAVDEENKEKVLSVISELAENLPEESRIAEPDLTITAGESDQQPEEMLTNESTLRLISLLKSLPHGLVKWSEEVEGLPQTSTNLAIVRIKGNKAKIQMMTRSSVTEELEEVRSNIKEISREYGALVRQSQAYSGWLPDLENPLLRIIDEEWKKITGKSIKTVVTHGGLECGVIMGKYPHLRAVSIGPTIQKAHEIGERVNIESVGRFYLLLKNILTAVVSDQPQN